jgi:FlaA1/EpsC-like NDP-sugar epimerase
MTKHIAEKYVQLFVDCSSTKFICVRFGNVLGSNGSVVPLFSRQILEGGPITITDPNMERYFMLISEAAQLILQSTVLGNGGEVFLLEMGKPVKIIDLANKMIHLAGFTPGNEIKIKIIGARQGEKLTEELFGADEEVLSSLHNKINLLKSKNTPNPKLPKQVDALIQMANHSTQEELRLELSTLINSIPITQ